MGKRKKRFTAKPASKRGLQTGKKSVRSGGKQTQGPSSSCSRTSSSCSQPERKRGKKSQSNPDTEASTCSSCSGPTGPKTEEIGKSLIKSPLDTHGYKMVRLAENGLQGLLISTCLHANKKPGKESCTSTFNKIVEFNNEYCNFKTQTGLPVNDPKTIPFSKVTSEQEKKLKQRREQREKKKQKRKQYMKCMQGVHEQDDEMQTFCNTKCIAELYIKAGFFQDPPEVQGMAHFCEHAISLGSKNFPEVEAFSKFVDKHGGMYNARTEEEGTTYYFYVNYQKIDEALEMFVDMFANPIFASGDKIFKEVDNLNSEFEIKRQNDDLRHAALMKSLVYEGHPIQNFGMGSYDTIYRKDLRELLIEWISRYYCSENMLFCIQGPMSLHQLEALFGKFCCKFPQRCNPIYKNISEKRRSSGCQGKRKSRKKLPVLPSSSPTPFNMEKWNRLYYMEALGSITYMTVSWALDPKFGKNFTTKPVLYFNYILNWKATGSLGWYLKLNGWITSLSVNSIQYPSLYTTEYYTWFSIYLELTSKGMSDRMNVLKVVFQYMKLIEEVGPSELIFNEIRQLQSDIFHYRSDMNLSDPTIGRRFDDRGVTDTIQKLLYTFSKTGSEEDVLLNTFLLREFNPQILQEFVSLLTPKNANVVIASKEFTKEMKQKEKWYKTSYFTTAICQEFLVDVEKSPRPNEFCFPKKNAFLEVSFCFPDTMGGKEKVEKKSELLIYETVKGEIFYGNEKCKRGLLPSSQYILDFYSPALQDDFTMYNAPSADLLVLTLKYVLESVLSLALSSLISLEVEGVAGSIRVVLSGPSPKLPYLAKITMTTVQMIDIHILKRKGLVEDLKRTVMGSYIALLNESEGCALSILSYLLSRRSSFLSDYLGVLSDSYCLDDFLFFVKEFQAHQFISGYLYGCVTRTHASEVAKMLEIMNYAPFRDTTGRLMIDRTIELPVGERCILVTPRSKENRISTVLNYYQISCITAEERHIFNAICAYLGETVFEELRTIACLGYDAVASDYESAGVVGITIFVQGVADNHTTGYINEEIDKFLCTAFSRCLSSPATFKSELLEFVDVNVDVRYKVAKTFYERYLLPNGEGFRKVSIQVQGFKKDQKSKPKQPALVKLKMEKFRSNKKLELCGASAGSDECSCGISRYSTYVNLCLKDVIEENGYFITDVQKFKDSLNCFPNTENFTDDNDD